MSFEMKNKKISLEETQFFPFARLLHYFFRLSLFSYRPLSFYLTRAALL
jgi:hypothetical protein